MRVTIFVIALFIPSRVFAADWFSWDRSNTLLHVPLTVTMVIDLGQTLDIAKSNENESNVILGRHPEQHEVFWYFIASYITTTLFVYTLPPRLSHAFQVSVIVVEINYIAHNFRAGLQVAF